MADATPSSLVDALRSVLSPGALVDDPDVVDAVARLEAVAAIGMARLAELGGIQQ